MSLRKVNNIPWSVSVGFRVHERLRVKSWACTYCFIPVEINGQIEVWPQVFRAFPSFLTTAHLITPKLFQAHQLLTVGNCEQLSEALPVFECLHHSHLSPTSFWQYLLAALGLQQSCPIFAAPTPLGRCRVAFGLKCLRFDVAFSAGKTLFGAFSYFFFFFPPVYLFITELSVRRQNWLSGIFKLQESYKAEGSAR